MMIRFTRVGPLALGLFLVGLALLFIPYKIHEEQETEIYVQQHSPVIRMPIVARVKRWGTVRMPNKIYVRYKEKEHVLLSSNKHFASVADLDSIDVNYDRRLDKAVLANVKINRYYPLLILVAFASLIAISSAIVLLRQQSIKNRHLI